MISEERFDEIKEYLNTEKPRVVKFSKTVENKIPQDLDNKTFFLYLLYYSRNFNTYIANRHVQCPAKRNRSLIDLYYLFNQYKFITVEDFINLVRFREINMLYCPNINRVVFLVGGFDLDYILKKLK